MLQRTLPLLVLFIVLKCLGCSCSAVGYPYGAYINVLRPAWSSEPLTVDIDMDGVRVRCTNVVPGSGPWHVCDSDVVFVTYDAESQCSGCDSNEVPRLHISTSTTPECIEVSIAENGMLLGKTTFEPTYESTYHEGLGCGESLYWSGRWTLP